MRRRDDDDGERSLTCAANATRRHPPTHFYQPPQARRRGEVAGLKHGEINSPLDLLHPPHNGAAIAFPGLRPVLFESVLVEL